MELKDRIKQVLHEKRLLQTDALDIEQKPLDSKWNNELIDTLFNLFGVSRSVGKGTKPVLKTATKEQMKKTGVCKMCIYKDLPLRSDECNKCRSVNKYNQYYG